MNTIFNNIFNKSFNRLFNKLYNHIFNVKQSIFLIILLTLLISSCEGGSNNRNDDEFPTGFDGVDISLNIVSHRKDQKIIPDDTFDFEVELNNNGGYDSERASISVQPPSVLTELEKDLEEEINLQKEDYYVGYFRYDVTGVPGGGTTEKGNMITRVCYDYKTQLTISACTGKPETNDICDIQKLTNNNQRINYGQGAPIWIESVDESFVRRGNKVVPKFNIKLNKVKHNDDVYKIKEGELCGGERNGFDYKITFSGGLTYDSRIEGEQDFVCNPENPIFNREEDTNNIIGEINCELREEKASDSRGIASTILTVEIFYDYATRVSEQLTFAQE